MIHWGQGWMPNNILGEGGGDEGGDDAPALVAGMGQ